MLTFEAIREIERQERDNKKIQKLPDNISEEIRDYIRRKEKIGQKSTTDILEIENVRKTIKSFFELRERKLVAAALSSAQSGLPAENLTSQEKNLFFNLVDIIKRHRENFFSEINREEDARPLEEKKAEEKTIYRVKKELREFIGPDMKSYRLIKGEVVNLPKPLNDLLLKEGILEEIRE